MEWDEIYENFFLQYDYIMNISIMYGIIVPHLFNFFFINIKNKSYGHFF